METAYIIVAVTSLVGVFAFAMKLLHSVATRVAVLENQAGAQLRAVERIENTIDRMRDE